MLTLEEIHKIHLKVKSGVDFPKYVQDLISIGVQSYDNYVEDGRSTFFTINGYSLGTEPKYNAIKIAKQSNIEKLKQILLAHQQGKIDFDSFCHQVATVGVKKWKVDTSKMTCAYYDRLENVLLEESIPKVH